MEIKCRSYESKSQAVLFEVIDEGRTYVCGVTLKQLDPDKGGLIGGDEGLSVFDSRVDEILLQASVAVSHARTNGIEHTAGENNVPIFVQLQT